jgi:hypothetical protein
VSCALALRTRSGRGRQQPRLTDEDHFMFCLADLAELIRLSEHLHGSSEIELEISGIRDVREYGGRQWSDRPDGLAYVPNRGIFPTYCADIRATTPSDTTAITDRTLT